MTTQQTSSVISTNLLADLRPIRLLTTLKRLRFNGQLVLTDPTELQWNFSLYQGNLLYASGGIHPSRRWRRNLRIYCPQILADNLPSAGNISESEESKSTICWEYQQLCLWIVQQKITQQQAAKMIRAVMSEVLFDLAQAVDVTHQLQASNLLTKQAILIDIESAIAELQPLWEVWQHPQLIRHSPNQVPVIKQLDQLKKRTSQEVYQSLTKLLDGQKSLRDIAVEIKRDIVDIILSLLPYIELGWVELIPIPDLTTSLDQEVSGKPANTPDFTKPLIACVDDSLLVCRSMEKLLTAAGYRFVSVNDSLRAIATLLSCKPDLIFLDLVMPNTNGYELCQQLRKLSSFHHTPILILTGKDGHADRLRAKFVGASGFLSKPIDGEKVLNAIRTNLNPSVVKY